MISFIVIGHNEEKNLKRCFESIFNTIEYNRIKDYEVIYVDSKSTDRSIIIAQKFKGVKIFLIKGYCNAAVGRNIGAKESHGKVLFFIDGDMEIEKEFLSHVLDPNANLKYNFVSGQVIDVVEGISIKVRNILKNNSSETISKVSPGGIFIIRKECWNLVKGMKTKFNTGEEADLVYRLIKKGFFFTRRSEIITKHYTYMNLDLGKMWKGIISKAAFYPRCVTYRDHFTNKFLYYGMWASDKTFMLIFISIVLILLMPITMPYLIFIYLLAILLRSIKQNKKISGIKYLFYFLVLDFLNLIYLFIFFPKNKKLDYMIVNSIS